MTNRGPFYIERVKEIRLGSGTVTVRFYLSNRCADGTPERKWTDAYKALAFPTQKQAESANESLPHDQRGAIVPQASIQLSGDMLSQPGIGL